MSESLKPPITPVTDVTLPKNTLSAAAECPSCPAETTQYGPIFSEGDLLEDALKIYLDERGLMLRPCRELSGSKTVHGEDILVLRNDFNRPLMAFQITPAGQLGEQVGVPVEEDEYYGDKTGEGVGLDDHGYEDEVLNDFGGEPDDEDDDDDDEEDEDEDDDEEDEDVDEGDEADGDNEDEDDMRITLHCPDYMLPIYHRYPGEQEPQDAYLEIDPERGSATLDYDGELGNAVPSEVWHGLVRRVSVPAAILYEDAMAFLSEAVPLVRRVVNGYEQTWNGNNHVGRYTARAKAALKKIEQLAETISTVTVWGLEEWFENTNVGDLVKDGEDLSVAADRLDDEALGQKVYLDGNVENYLRKRLGR